MRMRMIPDKGFVFPLGHPASISIIYQPGIIIITSDSSGWNCQKHHHLNHHNCITSSFSTFIKSCTKKKRPGMRPTVFPKLLRALWVVSTLLHFVGTFSDVGCVGWTCNMTTLIWRTRKWVEPTNFQHCEIPTHEFWTHKNMKRSNIINTEAAKFSWQISSVVKFLYQSLLVLACFPLCTREQLQLMTNSTQ